MRTRLVFAVLAFTGAAFGATCNAITNLSALQSAGSCNIGSVTFSGFNIPVAYLSSTSASSVSVASSGTGLAGDFAGLAFSTTGGWTGPMSLTYSVACSGCAFSGSHFNGNLQPVIPSGNPMTFSRTDAGGIQIATASNQDMGHAWTGSASLVADILAPGRPQDRLQAFENDFYVANPTPEPSTFFLLGGALIALGTMQLGKRRRA
jgi:hypothetical protein